MARGAKVGDDKPIRIGLLEVERKTDVLALAAFVIAVFGTALQILSWARGPQIDFFAPDRVVVYAYTQQNGAVIARVAAPMSYTNTAPEAYAASLRHEWATLRTSGLSSRQIWTSFGQLQRNTDGFAPTYEHDAAPLPIKGGDAVSHTTFFSPQPDICQSAVSGCSESAQFVTVDQLNSVLGKAPIIFTFEAELYGRGTLSRTCQVDVGTNVVSQWMLSEPQWFVAPCRPIDRSWLDDLLARTGLRRS